MKRNLLVFPPTILCVVWMSMVPNSLAASQRNGAYTSQMYAVENMTCAACPITVRKAMSRVDGVQSVTVDFKAKTVTAVFDPERTDAATIANASSSVGFPALPVKEPAR